MAKNVLSKIGRFTLKDAPVYNGHYKDTRYMNKLVDNFDFGAANAAGKLGRPATPRSSTVDQLRPKTANTPFPTGQYSYNSSRMDKFVDNAFNSRKTSTGTSNTKTKTSTSSNIPKKLTWFHIVCNLSH